MIFFATICGSKIKIKSTKIKWSEMNLRAWKRENKICGRKKK